MCGIAGIVGKGADCMSAQVEAMNAIQLHRGPDDSGLFSSDNLCLGHRRLSIIDLSQSGRQPMVDLESGNVISYNGEIYNYLELRNDLEGRHRFRTDTDTEVILKLYQDKGIDCLKDLRGMFSFVIWDHSKKELFVARDRFGIKPLYFSSYNERFYFASEIKALLVGGLPVQASMEVIGDYLRYGLYDHGSDTFFKGIKRLLPGHYLRVDRLGVILEDKTYYNLQQRLPELWSRSPKKFEEEKEEFLSVIQDSLALHARSDVPVGVNISGGVDSSAVLALAKNVISTPTLHCFSKDYKDSRYSEAQWVKALIDDKKLECHFCLTGAEECAKVIDNVLWHQDEPFGGVPTLAWYSLFGHAHELGITVLLDGSGVDDFTAGYQPHVIHYLSQIEGTSLFEKEATSYCQVWGQTPANFKRQIEQARYGTDWLKARDTSSPVKDSIVLDDIPYRDIEGPDLRALSDYPVQSDMLRGFLFSKLPRALRFKDRNSMAFSCELRVPFLDHKVVEAGYKQPLHYLIQNGQGKHILREALKGVIPEKVRNAPKRTVQTPQREWFSQGPFANILDETLNEPSSFLTGVIDVQKAREEVRRFRDGENANANYLWQWINLERWYRMYFEGDIVQKLPNAWPKSQVNTYTAREEAA